MPVLNFRTQTEAWEQEGKSVALPPGATLLQTGPRVPVVLSPLAEQLQTPFSRGEAIPSPVTGHALIDTGASVTCIDRDAAKRAGLAIVDSGPMHSATHANEIVPIYAGRLSIQGLPNDIEARRAFGANLKSQGLTALIGRDVLAQCMFVYNGTDSSFSLAL